MSSALSTQAANDSFHTISFDQLDNVSGGGWAGTAAKFIGKKVLGPVAAAYSAYEGVKGYLNARDQGKGVGESLLQGAKDFVF
jgi:hypothetical protein